MNKAFVFPLLDNHLVAERDNVAFVNLRAVGFLDLSGESVAKGLTNTYDDFVCLLEKNDNMIENENVWGIHHVFAFIPFVRDGLVLAIHGNRQLDRFVNVLASVCRIHSCLVDLGQVENVELDIAAVPTERRFYGLFERIFLFSCHDVGPLLIVRVTRFFPISSFGVRA